MILLQKNLLKLILKISNKNIIKFIINDDKYEYKVNVPEYFKNMLKAKRLTLPKNFQKIIEHD